MTSIDLNSDLGESFGAWQMGDDAAMLGIVTTANVACGFHAGDPLVMWETCTTAKAQGVAIGAHPSLMDLWGFGRRPIQGERPDDIMKQVVYQVAALQGIAAATGHRVTHVKTHGSLNNMAWSDEALALAVAEAVRTVDRDLVLVVMPGSAQERAGQKLDLRLAREVFADRAYDDQANLVSRKLEGAVIHDAQAASQRVLRMLADRAITSQSGRRIPVAIDTVCVHGDNHAAVAMAGRIRSDLEAAGIALKPFA